MSDLVAMSDGNTPLTAEELRDLIPSLATKEELNEWERQNILDARAWALRDKSDPAAIVTDQYVRKLHEKMFDQTWHWAGQYRNTERNLGVPFHEIREQLATLFGDARYWIERGTYPADEIAVRFHYRLVVVHPFPNGNGRHARLIADILAMRMGRQAFTWGSADIVGQGTARTRYLQAMRTADAGEIADLLAFARS